MNIKEYLKNVHGKIKKGYTEEAREMLDSLRISLDGTARLGDYKATGLRLEKDIDMIDRKEVYVLKLRQGTPEYDVGKKVLDIIPKMYKWLKIEEAKKPAESTSLETRVQRDARIKENAQNLIARSRIFKESIKDIRQKIYGEEPVPTKQEAYNVRNPIQTVSDVTESALKECRKEPEKIKVYIEEPLPESLRLYLQDAYNKIEDGKLKEAREKLGKIGKVTMNHHPTTFRLLYKKLAKAENEKRASSNVFWNKCKRAVAYGLIGALLLGFTGMSVKHELELRSMKDLPERLEPIPPYSHQEEIDRLLRGNNLFRIDPEKRWAYKEIMC